MPLLDGATGGLPGAHGVEEIHHVQQAEIGLHFGGLALGVLPARRETPLRVAHEHRALFAIEKDAVVRLGRVLLGAPHAVAPRDRAAFEFKLRRERVRRRDFARQLKQAAGRADRLGRLLAENHARGVDQMEAPVVKMALAGGLFLPPVLVADLRAVGNERGRAAPEIPVEGGGRRHRRRTQHAVGEMDLGLRLHDAAELPVGDELLHRLIRRALPALEADLHDSPALGDGVDHRAAFADVVGERLLAVNVEPALDTRHQLQRVPMRRRADDDRLEAGRREHVLVELEGLWPRTLEFFDVRRAFFEMRAVHIAEREHLDPAGFERGVDVDHAIPTAADEAEFHFAPGARRRFRDGGGATGSRGVGTPRMELGKGGGTGGDRTEELAAVERLHGAECPRRAERRKAKTEWARPANGAAVSSRR